MNSRFDGWLGLRCTQLMNVCVCVKNGSGFVIISVIAVISIVKFIQLFRKQLCNRGDKRYMLTCI